MNLNEYQTEAHDYADYNDMELYPFLGLAGEAGEVCEVVKKIFRRDKRTDLRNLPQVDRVKIESELGDVMWYVAEIATQLGFTLEHIANLNLVKLSGRKARGSITMDDDQRARLEDESYE